MARAALSNGKQQIPNHGVPHCQLLIHAGAPVYLAAVLEYLALEAVELAGNCAQQLKRQRIAPRHVYLAVHQDDELVKLFANVTIPGGGVVPHIPEALLKPGRRHK